ncbi:MAG: preprotein translocase subunit SecG [Gelidibacter sp.]
MSTFTIFLALIIIVAFLLIIVIMVQEPKGGGLSSSFGGGGSQQMGGVKKTTDFLDKSTWILASAMLALILLSNITVGGANGHTESKALDSDAATTTAPAPTTNSANDATKSIDTTKN